MKKNIQNPVGSYAITLLAAFLFINGASYTWQTVSSNAVYFFPLDRYVEVSAITIQDWPINQDQQLASTFRSVDRNFIADIYHEPKCFDEDFGDYIKLASVDDDLIHIDRGVPIQRKVDPNTGEEVTRVNWRLPIRDSLRTELRKHIGERCGWQITYFFRMPNGELKEYPETFFAEYKVLPAKIQPIEFIEDEILQPILLEDVDIVIQPD